MAKHTRHDKTQHANAPVDVHVAISPQGSASKWNTCDLLCKK
eukprot:CAMPEP_0175846430 /NCGR_PEP_ID=MMETSP0107_2-20121207/22786_1 /TAXON_ID=195067 ORGANISM="Goniomonas pacifica, Strain CCMP1869" /NCGR_SAMPLE_ID=MMETSP0107_2 /ASSEMBLY_ACC=CAM_ASM_000203 /LENGTH=41 /DNA_ID= /DNA_START= /DNA_END= /DNA_ORIENTATION=